MGAPKGLIPWNKGKKTGSLSEERKHKMSIAKKGKLPKNFALLHSPEIRKKAGLANRGKKRSDETKRRMSQAQMGNRNSLGAIPWNKGRTGIYSQEHYIQSFTDLLELNNVKTVEQAIECDELWNINNGLTLCKSCHRLSVGAELG